jgi:Cu(I)/Ag(I) efflux system protein CusF
MLEPPSDTFPIAKLGAMSRSTKLVQLLLPLAFAVSVAAPAQVAPSPAMPGRPASASAPAPQTLASGEVLEVDKQDQRVLLKHGPIQNLGMDAMTMEFSVPDRKLLESLRPGDKIRFAAIWKAGDYELTRIERVKRHRSRRSESRTRP